MLLNTQTRIFEEFLIDFESGLTGSYIAKKKKLNQKTVANYLNLLEKQGILRSKVQGKNKLYYLNLENKEILLNFIMGIEHFRSINFYENNLIVKEIFEKINSFIDGIAVLFGSYAKGTQKKDSDLDILIIGKCDEKEIYKISKTYKIDINLKIYPKIEKDILFEEVLKNHILLKNIDGFIRGIFNG